MAYYIRTPLRILCVARGLQRGGVLYMIASLVSALQKTGTSTQILTDPESYTLLKSVGVPEEHCIVIGTSNKILWDLYTSYTFIRHHIDQSTVIFYTKNTIPHTHAVLPHRKWLFIHDLAHFYPNIQAYPWLDTLYMRYMIGRSLRHAEYIFAPSQNTVHDIQHFFTAPKERIQLLYESTDAFFHRITDTNTINATLKKYNITSPFIFYCGSISPRKNILLLLQSFYALQTTVPHTLYIVSGLGWNNSKERQFLQEHPDLRARILPFLSKEELRLLYSSASAYVFPSLYEGFGLPILEAQACGCPVITSRSSSCAEIAGQGAYIVNPQDPQSITDGIAAVLSDTNLSKKLVASGYKNVRKYSWDTAAATLTTVLTR